MTIRFANITDIENILSLEEEIYKTHLNKRPDLIDETKRLFNYNSIKYRIENDNGKIFLLEDENYKIIGYCITMLNEIINHQVFKDMKSLLIEDLYIDEKHRRKGLGKKLFEEVKKYGKEKNVNFIELDVWEFNQNAKSFYEYLGMKTRTNRMELMILRR